MESAISLREDATLDEALEAALIAHTAAVAEFGRPTYTTYDDAMARAEHIYNARYRAKFEPACLGQFVAIDIDSEQAYLGDTMPDALLKLLRASLAASFFVFEVGSEAVFDHTPVA